MEFYGPVFLLSHTAHWFLLLLFSSSEGLLFPVRLRNGSSIGWQTLLCHGIRGPW